MDRKHFSGSNLRGGRIRSQSNVSRLVVLTNANDNVDDSKIETPNQFNRGGRGNRRGRGYPHAGTRVSNAPHHENCNNRGASGGSSQIGVINNSNRDLKTVTKNKSVGPGTLRVWLEDYPSKVLNEIIIDKYGFPEALSRVNFIQNYARDIILVIGRALSSDQKAVGTKLLLNVIRSSKFVRDGLIHYYSQIFMKIHILDEENEQLAFKDSCLLIKNLLETFPSCNSDLIASLALVEQIFRKLKTDSTYRELQSNDLIHSANTLYDEIKMISDSLIEDVNINKVDIISKDIRDPKAPPNNFRELSVFPDVNNDLLIHEAPFLRPIEPKKKFDNVEQYLDIHFRLLKEDFVQPLRNGIREYLLMNDKKMLRSPRKKLLDIKVYQNVQILNPECSRNGILYRIIFDLSKLKHVKWEYSKRFIYGSLLCFSHDNFKSIFIATVVERDVKLLAQGILIVKFESDIRNVDNFTTFEFDMIETSAFFESYRHVLNALQSIDEQNFPFQNIIVKCEKNINEPSYVKQNYGALFDFSFLFPNNSKVSIMDLNSWPSAENINFDNSQMKALISALQSELCLIQGPPGTGKTFIGLKIVQLLNENWKVWNNHNTRPILVICYTNHALDQFLEGIADFMTTGIIRVGGRSKSKKIDNFLLKNIKSNVLSNRRIPKELFEGKQEARSKMLDLEASLENVAARVKILESGLIHEDVIRPFMLPYHQHFFTKSSHVKSLIPMWLQVESLNDEVFLEQEFDNLTMDEEHENNDENCQADDEEECIDVADEAELEELNRILEMEDDIKFIDKNKIKSKLIKVNANDDAKQILSYEFKENGEDWKVKTKRKNKFMKHIRKMLLSRDIMSEHEVGNIRNIMLLQPKDKWRLYRYWVNLYKKSLIDKIKQAENEYQLQADRVVELMNQEDQWIMEQSKLIGMTTTGAARYSNVLSKIKPRIVIVEEAAEVLEAHITTNLTSGCEHLILIGDHKQLRPNPSVYKLAVDYNLNCSLFERLIMNDIPHVTLEKQHRMRPQIADMARVIYPELKDDDSVLKYDDIKGICTNVFLFNHQNLEITDQELVSRSNPFEAEFLTKLCRYLIQQGYSPEQITVLTPYSGQMYYLKKCMPKRTFNGVHICPIDNYQGEENDIILLSMVRSNIEGDIGFLKEDNRVCVALTRAKKALYVVGNFDMLRRKSKLWSKILEVATKHEPPFLGISLLLACENHPNESKTEIKSLEDFNKVPEGGCLIPCQFRLKCGHVCTRVCHVQDKDHKNFKCLKPCAKMCLDGHPCKKKCSESCGKCMIPVQKIIPMCGHTQTVPCSIEPEKFVCKIPCQKTLACGHKCSNSCGESCTKNCEFKFYKLLPCGDTIKVNCYENSEVVDCIKPCGGVLDCSHLCVGTCGECFKGKVHKACGQPCTRVLICDHQCHNPCHESCPPCKQPCQTRCNHSKCSKKCGEICINCNETCEWKCKHFTCTMLCHEPCNRTKCNYPCEKLLPCKHPCVGLCGEKCPKLCRICNEFELTETFFGTEDEPAARFVILEDCPHTFEASSLDNWVKQSMEKDSAIKLLCCPKCKTPIRRNLRYGTEINTIFNKIQLIKSKTNGLDIDLSAKKQELLKKIKPHHTTYRIMLTKSNWNMSEMISFETAYTLLEHSKKSLLNQFIIQQENLDKLRKRIKKSMTSLSRQECKELQMEILRYDLMIMFEECRRRIMTNTNTKLLNEHRESFLYTFNILQSNKLDEDFEKKARNVLKNTIKCLTGLGISEIERVQIIKALPDVQKGAWFECPNGHLYAIGDCGGAVEESRCNECNAVIGGHSHTLRGDNRWNRDMDGSNATAWPTTLFN